MLLDAFHWIFSAAAWTNFAIWMQLVGFGLFIVTLMQLAPDDMFGGSFFKQTNLFITLGIDAVYLLLIAVFPAVKIVFNVSFGGAGLAIVGIIVLIVLAVLAYRHFNK